MQGFSVSPREIFASALRNRSLLKQLLVRDISERYRGSVAGGLWTLFHPLLMLATYSFVFGAVFKAAWFPAGGSKATFALALFAGLMVFNFFSESVNRAPGSILGNANFVKKVVFPLEVLPLVAIGSALIHFFVSFAVWCLFCVFVIGMPAVSVLLLPLILVPFVCFTAGVCWLVSSLSVYLRDMAEVVSIALSALMFLSPVFYPMSALPAGFESLLRINPLVFPIESTRALLLEGRLPEVRDILLNFATSGLVAWLGFAWFQKTRKGFADVL